MADDSRELTYMSEDKLEHCAGHYSNLSMAEMELDCDFFNINFSLLDKINLSNRERECLYFYYWQGMKIVDIAKELEISQPSISIYLKRAKVKIANYYNLNLDEKKFKRTI